MTTNSAPEHLEEIRWLPYNEGEGWLVCKNDRFQHYAADGQTVLSELVIPQQDGIDTVDRIEYFKANPL